jgi:tetratricopeptide (TPR) repeat protein
MRKIFLYIGFIFSVSGAFAQHTVVSDAYNFLQSKDLVAAQKAIDEACMHPETSNDPKALYIKGFIYKEIYKDKETNIHLSPARAKSLEALRKNISADSNNIYAEQCRKLVNYLMTTFYNDATANLNVNKFQQAFENYEKYLEQVRLNKNTVDGNAVFLAGYTAFMVEKWVEAEKYLNEAITLNHVDPNLYLILGKVYWAQKKSDKALQVLDIGNKKYPDQKDFILLKINYYLELGRLKELNSDLQKAIKLEPQNIDLKIMYALVCEKLSETDKANSEKYFQEAEKSYKEVVELNNNHYKANYNLAILYYNKAVNIINELDYDQDMVAFNNIQEECLVIFKKSLPYMNKAYQLDSSRLEVLEGLAGIYFSLNEFDLSNQFKAKVSELQNKK